MNLKKYFSPLQPVDFVVIVFAAFLIALDIIFHSSIEHHLALISVNVIVIIFVLMVANFDVRYENKLLKSTRSWYIAPMILLTYKQLSFMIAPIHGKDYDTLLIEIDRWLFGVDPTVWMWQFSHPLLTEIVQIAYTSFYFLFIIAGYELYKKGEFEKFYYAAFLIVYGFYLSYIGYLFLPAVGPRFTLHDFGATNTELPGLFITNFLRDFVNYGGSIVKGHPNPIEIVQRDVFPSGHTQLTLVLMYISAHYNLKSKLFLWVIGILLIFGTVYLRYHYVIDLIAGGVFMILNIGTAKFVYNGWNNLRMRWRG
ncbi:MAG: phosphatase PAP2 family protein [Bacteroidota bacterium]|nr:phosphatase PAP2 family protein [Bacteroidota bacterium]